MGRKRCMLRATRVAAIALTLALLALPGATPAAASTGTGPSLDGLGGVISDALSSAISGAMDTFWTNFATKLPALVVGSFFTFVAKIAEWLYRSLEDLIDSVNVITQTPLSLTILELPAVKSMFNGLQGVAFAAVGVVIVLVGFGIMARMVLGSSYPELLEMLPRLVIALLWVASTPLWFRLAIEFTNALCAGLLH